MSAGAILPIPQTVLRVGMTGHRLNKLSADKLPAIENTLQDILAKLQVAGQQVVNADRALLGEAARFVLVSSVAEGADRIAATAALRQGWELQCPLPFERAEYRTDSSNEASAAEFDALIGQAKSTFAIDAKRPPVSPAGTEGRPYETASLVMMRASDLIIAVWDGRPPDGLGGTAFVVQRAVQEEIPVIVVNSADPDGPRILWTGFDTIPASNPRLDRIVGGYPTNADNMHRLVDALLSPPADPNARAEINHFLHHRVSPAKGSFAYGLLKAAVGIRSHKGDDDTESRGDWDSYLAAAPQDSQLGPSIAANLRPAFEEADRKASKYATDYRDAFVFNYLAATFAVLVALGGLFVHGIGWKAILVSIELVVLGSILINTSIGQHRRIHKRWLDYRRLAEHLRQMRFVVWSAASTGLARPVGRSAGALAGARDWVNWYSRAVRRTLPLPNATASEVYLTRYANMLKSEEVKTQIRYHDRAAESMERLDHRLHVLGDICFGLSAVACFFYLVYYYLDAEGLEAHYATTAAVITAITAFLPALGAAAKAIRAQGDFKTISERSAATSAELRLILQDLERVEAEKKLSLEFLSDRTDKASTAMLRDLSQWRMLSETRPLSLPA